MKILRKHDQSIEKHAGYACMKCLGKDDKVFTTQIGKVEILNPLKNVEAAHKLYDEIFSSYAWPGGYPIIFITDRSDVFCAECAKRFFIMEREDITTDIYYEGPPMYCDACNKEIESAYGDPDQED